MGYQKSKGEWGDSAAQPAIPPGDHSGTEAKGKMTGESTCHPWHPLLAGCSSLLSSGSLLPARRAQFKARHIFLFSLSSCVNKKQTSPLSCDQEPGSYNLFSGASLGWQEWSAGKLCLLTPPFGWQKVSSHLPSPNCPCHTDHSLEDWLEPQWSLQECLSNSTYIAWFFSWLH